MKAWWLSRSARERQVLGVAAVLTVLMLGWAWVWDPLQGALSQERQRVQASEAAWQRLQRMGDDYRTLRERLPVSAQTPSGSLLVRVDAGLNGSGIGHSVLRVDPLDAGRVRVQFQAVEFDALMRWLETQAASDGLRIREFAAQRVSAGRVDATLIIEEREV